MATLEVNIYATWDLTDIEIAEGSILTVQQKQVIQNRLASEAESKMLLEPDPNDIPKFLQQESYKRGGIEMLQYLLAQSDAFEQEQIHANNEAALLNSVDESTPSMSEIFQ